MVHVKVDTGDSTAALRQVEQRLQSVAKQGMTVQVSLNRAFASVNTKLSQMKNTLTPVASVGIQLFARLLSLMQPAAQGLTNLVTTLFGAKWTGISTGLDSAASGTEKVTSATTRLAKAQRDLLGFDEIQRLSASGGTASGGGASTGGGGKAASGSTIQIETVAWAERLKTVLEQVWEPFRAAWRTKGKEVLSSAQGMLKSLGAAAAQVGQTWLGIWTDGTGQRILEGVLGIAADLCSSVGSLADRFREAWNSAGNGERIVGALLGLLEDGVNTIGRMAEATKTWAAGLDLTPVTGAFATLLEKLRELSGVLGDGLAWGYENILLPLAKWTMEKGGPAALTLLSGALELVTGALTVLQPIGLAVWEGFLKPLASWGGDVAVELMTSLGEALSWCGQQLQTLAGVLNSTGDWRTKLIEAGGHLVDGLKVGITEGLAAIGAWLDANIVQPIVSGVKSLFGIASPSTVFAEIGRFLIEGLCGGMKERLLTAWTGLSGAWTALKAHFTDIGVKVTAAVATTWTSLQEKWTALKGHFTNIGVKVTATIATTWSSLQEKWSALTSNLKDKTVSFSAKVVTTAESLWNKFKSGWSGKSLGLTVTWVTSGLNAIQLAVSKTLFGGRGWPKLAFAARGGVFDDPTLTVLGEAGREAVVPLENNTGWMDVLARRIAAQTSGGGTGGAQSITVQCVLDGKIIAENTVRYVNGEARRTGVHPLAAYL